MTYHSASPTGRIDHLPQSVRDRDCIARDDEIERRKVLYREARAISAALRSVVDHRHGGKFTRAEGAVLAALIRGNLRACVRKELFYRPTRRALAKDTGYSERTVSRAIGSVTRAGLIVVARYAKGGRMGDKGKGISTEFRSGCLQFVAGQLAALGYRLPKSLKADLDGIGRWAADQVGEHPPHVDAAKSAEPTGTKCPGIVMQEDRAAPGKPDVSPVSRVAGALATVEDKPPAAPPGFYAAHCHENGKSGSGSVPRPPLSGLARAAMPCPSADMVPMPLFGRERGFVVGGFLFALCGVRK